MSKVKWKQFNYMRGSSVDERVLGKVRYDRGCWTFQGATASNGYGRVYTPAGTKAAHRVVYEALIGPVPKNTDLDHLCRNRACVNPYHLEPVSRKTNLNRGAKPGPKTRKSK